MQALDKWDMQYIVACGALVSWRNPTTKTWEPYPFKQERLAFLDSLLIDDDSHLLYRDNHGVNIHLCAYREVEGGPLLGFLWASSSEESFYGTDYFNEKDVGPFEVTCKEIVAYEYQKADGSSWRG